MRLHHLRAFPHPLGGLSQIFGQLRQAGIIAGKQPVELESTAVALLLAVQLLALQLKLRGLPFLFSPQRPIRLAVRTVDCASNGADFVPPPQPHVVRINGIAVLG